MRRTLMAWMVLVGLGGAGCVPPDGGSNGNDNGTANGNTNDNNANDNSGDLPPLGEDIAVTNEGATHVAVGEQVTYVANPPASGSHWSSFGVAPVAAGFYEQQLEEEQWIHNLEHGYVVILYDCGGECSEGILTDLQGLFDAAPPSPIFGNVKLVITEYAGLPYLITAVSWDVQRHFDTFDEAALVDFYETHVDMAPEGVP